MSLKRPVDETIQAILTTIKDIETAIRDEDVSGEYVNDILGPALEKAESELDDVMCGIEEEFEDQNDN